MSITRPSFALGFSRSGPNIKVSGCRNNSWTALPRVSELVVSPVNPFYTY